MKTKQCAKILAVWLSVLALFELGGCSTTRSDGAPSEAMDVNSIHDAVPRAEARNKYANPSVYVVNGVRYHVLPSAKGYDKVGLASWYGTKFHGHMTSSHEPYNMFQMTAASCTLPIPTYVRVTNLNNGKSVIVKVNDRGPFKSSRLIDLSYVAAKKLGYAGSGTARVRVTAIDTGIQGKQLAENTAPPSPEAALSPKEHLRAHPVHFENKNLAMARNYLQVGAFVNRHNAEQLRQKVQHLTHAPITIKASHHPHNSIYRVQIGPLAKSQLVELQQRLTRHGMGKLMSTLS